MTLPFPVVRRGGDRVSEREEAGGRAAVGGEPVDEQLIFMAEHLLEPLTGDVTPGVPVDGVTDAHVVSRHALGHGAGGAAGLEEVADDLLPRSDLGEGSVSRPVEIDGQGLAGHRR